MSAWRKGSRAMIVRLEVSGGINIISSRAIFWVPMMWVATQRIESAIGFKHRVMSFAWVNECNESWK